MDLPALSSPLYLIDALGPFFSGYDRSRINWSKLPWSRFQEMTPEELRVTFCRVGADMKTFCRSVAKIGYNGVTLDDLPHLALHEGYEDTVNDRITLYRAEFRELFKIILEEGLHLYLTMDLLTLTPQLKRSLGNDERKQNEFLTAVLDRFFIDFPEVAGVVLRIGESDGLESSEDLRSTFVLKSPARLNRALSAVLPVFEQHRRRCIFRTWTVAARGVGDLIWHDATLEKTVAGLSSPALVLSMRSAESGFFRYLPLNRNFFVTALPKIVELQARREHEGCGEYPSFVGGDHEELSIELRDAPRVIGISVSCQTGGWTPFRRLAFIDGAAIWTEINAFVTLRLFKHGELVEEALSHLPEVTNPSALSELLRLSEEVVEQLLYLPDFARARFYFRRARLAPLLGVFGRHLFVAPALKRIFGNLVEDGEVAIRSGQAAMAKIRRMRTLALQCHLPEEDIEYMEYTFGILALAREYYFRPEDDEIRSRLETAKQQYKRRYPQGSRPRYIVTFDFSPFKLHRHHLALLFQHLRRGRPGDRFVDKIIGLRLFSITYFLLKRSRPKLVPPPPGRSAEAIATIDP